MVKFQKQLEGQLVPEWKEAYVNYKLLKKDLNQIKERDMKQQHIRQHQYIKPIQDYNTTQQQLLSSLGSPLKAIGQLAHHTWALWSQGGTNMVIHHRRSESCGGGEDLFETEILATASQTESQKVFFARLDAQLNMVNKFYKCKEEEYLTWASKLQKQMDILIETQRALSSQKLNGVSLNDFDSDEKVKHDASADMLNSEKRTKLEGKTSDEVCLSKNKVHRADKMLRTAFTEFYRGLSLLKNYSSLNMAAFSKILKKYDKITGQNASNIFLRAVECSYFASSDKVVKVMDKVESLFTEHFAKNNHREALAYLRPVQQNGNHSTTFFLGIFSGSSVSLLVIFILLITMQPEWKGRTETDDYMQSVFPTFSTLALFLNHLYMYGCNVYLWQRVRINYAFIFEFTPGTELRFRDVLVLSTGLTTVLLGGMIMQLILYTSVIKLSAHQHGDMVLITVIMVFWMLLFLPIDVCYKSTRFMFLRCIGRIICSPLYKVTLSDFFLADQLTSQIMAFRNLAGISCYYGCRYFRTHESTVCTENILYKDFEYLLSVLPYWWRLMQCVRRWLDEGDRAHIANGGKYLSALLAVVMRLTFQKNNSVHWLIGFTVSSAIATCYQLYWDIVVDWGFLQHKSVNPWLRDQLILKQKFIYFISMGINTVLRLTWLFSVLHLHTDSINHNVLDFVFASVEVHRRGLWNFFRLENEHLNNAGRYRAVKTVPLPFKDVETAEF